MHPQSCFAPQKLCTNTFPPPPPSCTNTFRAFSATKFCHRLLLTPTCATTTPPAHDPGQKAPKDIQLNPVLGVLEGVGREGEGQEGFRREGGGKSFSFGGEPASEHQLGLVRGGWPLPFWFNPRFMYMPKPIPDIKEPDCMVKASDATT